jgi:hypothetical protein
LDIAKSYDYQFYNYDNFDFYLCTLPFKLKKMKMLFLFTLILILPVLVFGQDIKISLRVSNQSLGSGGGKGIKFIIKIADTAFTSNDQGDLFINRGLAKKFANKPVLEFNLYNRLDMEFFREPMFTRTERTFGEYFNQVLIAAQRR